jgi:hypothetical protein
MGRVWLKRQKAAALRVHKRRYFMAKKKESCGCGEDTAEESSCGCGSVETQLAESQTERDRASPVPEDNDRYRASPVSTGCGCSDDIKEESNCGCSAAGDKRQAVSETASCGCSTKPETLNTTPDCSCGGPTREITKYKTICTAGEIDTPAGEIPVIPAELCITDVLGNLLVRFGINRNSHAVRPGLYAVGKPDKASPVLVSANYKMSFDALRRELKGLNAWILVIDSKGVNVWCAAGKGTFGSEELINRVFAVKLDKVVEHRILIVPQLGAPGVAAHTVRKKSGFKVVFGPVEARDIKVFLNNSMKADEKQRTVEFGLVKRLEVTGIEFVTALQIFIGVSAAAVLAASFTKTGFSLATGFISASYFIAAMFVTALSATVIPAALLPVLPGRMFSVKGAIAGLVSSGLFILLVPSLTHLSKVSIVLMSSAISSFVFMNYTGTSTFTSLTGVRKEIAVSVPVMAAAATAGLALQIVDFIIKGAIKWN